MSHRPWLVNFVTKSKGRTDVKISRSDSIAYLNRARIRESKFETLIFYRFMVPEFFLLGPIFEFSINAIQLTDHFDRTVFNFRSIY